MWGVASEGKLLLSLFMFTTVKYQVLSPSNICWLKSSEFNVTSLKNPAREFPLSNWLEEGSLLSSYLEVPLESWFLRLSFSKELPRFCLVLFLVTVLCWRWESSLVSLSLVLDLSRFKWEFPLAKGLISLAFSLWPEDDKFFKLPRFLIESCLSNLMSELTLWSCLAELAR